jgi:surfeit locus 1 family protein
MESPARGPRSLAKLVAMLAACALACAGFAALGVWQVHRLAWKEALIARVDRNVHGAPVPAPGPAQWPAISHDEEYRRMRAQGRFDYADEVLVAASTDLGAGYWVVTPLRTARGDWLLVNRGFVPPELRGKVPHGAPEQTVVGLLRFSEPGGRLFQHNEPASDRWYSRDVASIAATKGLTGAVAPFFLDAVAEPGAAPQWPRTGLTVLRFPNDHLVYAFTWFALAALMAAAFGYVVVDARRQRSRAGA